MRKFQEIMGMKTAIWLLVGLLVVAVLAAPFLYEEDRTRQNYIVGIASPGQGMKKAIDGFIEGMKKYGFEEGRNITYLIHSGKSGIDDALNEMLKKKVDLLFTMSTPITKRAKAITIDKQLPVIFIMHDPVASGVVDSLISPGGNLTGIQVHGSTSKALEWLQIIMPDVNQVFVPVGQASEAAVQSLQDLQMAGRELGISIVSEDIKTKEELQMVLDKMPKDADAIFVIHSVLVLSNMDIVEKIAMEKKVPIVSLHQSREAAITYGPDEYRVGAQAGRMANQVLKGVKPADMPIELADYYLGINLQKAKEVGVSISSEILLQADKIIR